MPELVFVCSALGIGGTERGMTTQALALNGGPFDVRVAAGARGGPQQGAIERAGLRVDVGDGTVDRLAELLEGADAVIHVRLGDAWIVPDACRRAGVRSLADWSIFGRAGPAGEDPYACHLFLSKMVALRHRRRLGDRGPGFHERHRVHPFPVDPALRELAPGRRDARRQLGLDPDRPVVGRTGRSDDTKWRNVLVDMVPRLLKDVPDAQVAFVGATAAKANRLRRLGVLDRCVLLDQTLDESRLAAFYAACDVFVSATEIGEAQGLANLEAMLFGVPVVTCSTPWADNAQVEWVEHGVTGLIANHPRPFAEAVAALLQDGELRERLGANARAAVERALDPAAQARQLERLLTSLIEGRGVPDEWSPSPDEVDAFEAEYDRRLALEYRPLRRRERLEAEVARLGERAARTLRSLRPVA